MAENVLLEKQDISGFFYNTTFGAYAVVSNSTPFVLEANGEYIILWDDVEHTRTAFSFTAADGSSSAQNLSGGSSNIRQRRRN